MSILNSASATSTRLRSLTNVPCLDGYRALHGICVKVRVVSIDGFRNIIKLLNFKIVIIFEENKMKLDTPVHNNNTVDVTLTTGQSDGIRETAEHYA